MTPPRPGRPSARTITRRSLATGAAGILAAARLAAFARDRQRPRQGGPARPFPQHVAYAAGTTRPNHRTQEQQDQDVRDVYAWWKGRYLATVKSKQGVLRRVRLSATGKAARATASEGQGYGMLIVATMAGDDPEAQAIFDGLWRFALRNRSCADSRLMRWYVPNKGKGCVDAFDGDADIAHALLLAHAQWGSGGGTDYLGAAQSVLAGLLASAVGPVSRYPLLGDWVDPTAPQPGQWTARTSDFMPDHFRAFARVADPAWGDVLRAGQRVVATIQQNNSPATGLLPEFVMPASAADTTPVPAAPDWAEPGGNDDGDYGSNACRVPWRLGVDALLNADADSLAATRKISHWIEGATGGNPQAIRYGYHLDGTPLPNSDFYLNSFGAPFGVAAMTDPAQQGWLNALYDTIVASRADYYEDSIALLCLLVLTGNTWAP